MDKTVNRLVLVVAGLGIIAVGISFYKNIVTRDFFIFAEAPCSPTTESCFVRDCNSDIERCTNDDRWVYKIIKKKAYTIPACDPYYGECDKYLTCQEDQLECEIIYCNPDNIDSDQECVR